MRLALHPDVDRALPLVERHTVSDAWAVNTYVARDIRCTYCITSAQGRSMPRYPADAVARQLREELDAIEEVDGLVVGPYCDVYPGPEAHLGVTRRARGSRRTGSLIPAGDQGNDGLAGRRPLHSARHADPDLPEHAGRRGGRPTGTRCDSGRRAPRRAPRARRLRRAGARPGDPVDPCDHRSPRSPQAHRCHHPK
jgi:hypothetical protein